MKISVTGVSCSGKTTLAGNIAHRLKIPHIELDALHWKSGWRPRPQGEFISLAEEALARPSWVMDGNYRLVRDRIWEEADLIIWLNYPFSVVFRRALWRSFSRLITRETIFSGNRESFAMTFFSRDSILLWVIRTYGKRKREYGRLFQSRAFSGAFIELKHPGETRKWLERRFRDSF